MVRQQKGKVRWCMSRDIQRMVEIESDCIENSWEAEDFEICLRSKNSNGIVVEYEGEVVGHLMFTHSPGRFGLVSVVVHPSKRRMGLGSKMVRHLLKKMDNVDGPAFTEVMVSERELESQQFFKSFGFLATGIKHHHFGPDHDGYRFQLKKIAIDEYGLEVVS